MLLTLADLIRAKFAERGWKSLAEKSALSEPLWRKLESGGNNSFPAPESIRGLALGLEIKEREVIIAAAVGLGFDMEDDSAQLGRMLPKEIDDLSDQSKRALADMAEALVKAECLDPAERAKKLAAEAKAVRKRIGDVKKR